MNIGIFLVFLIVMVFSVAIATVGKQTSLKGNPKKFLFGGNSAPLAMSSNIGSLLSLSVVFSLFSVGMIGYGFATFVATITGILCAYFVLFKTRKIIRNSFTQSDRDDFLLTTHILSNKRSILDLIIVMQYIIALICEYAVFQIFLRGTLEVDFPLFPLLSSLMVATLCAGYIFIGGYRGVLKTDIFQIIIFLGTCLIFLPKMLSFDGSIAQAVSDSRAWQLPALIGPVTWFSFTFVNFLSFPDVWVRNFGTLEENKFSSKWFFPLSLICLLIAIIPVLGLTCYGMETLLQFDQQYDVQRSYSFFKELFFNSNISEIFKLFIAASFASIFITTIDTWLIGILQYSSNINRLNGFNISSAVLFGTSILAALIGNSISASAVYIVGLFLFPFLFLNSLLFLSKINKKLYAYKGTGRYILGWSAGILATLFMIFTNWNRVQDIAPHIIFVGMIVQLITFWISTVIIKVKNCD